MPDIKRKNLRLFAQLDRMRHAWHNITPCPGLSKSDFATLMTIAHGGKQPHAGPCEKPSGSVTLTQLATVMQRSLPAISQRVRALEENGYVCRTGEESDRRVSTICLTAEGAALLEKARRQLGDTLDLALCVMTDEEMETLLALLAKLATALEGVGKVSPEELKKEN